MTALVIRGGHLIDPAAGVDALKDILLKDGRVAEIAGPGKLKQANGEEILDATGLTVAPGLVTCTSICASRGRATRRLSPLVRRRRRRADLRLWPRCRTQHR